MLRSYYGDHGDEMAYRQKTVGAITDDELLTWEIQLKREGTLPPEVQRRLLEHAADRLAS